MLRITGVELQKQWSTSKYRVRLWRWTNSISTKLSIALVMGVTLIPVIPRNSTATVAAASTQKPAETKVEVARVRTESVTEPRIAREPVAVADMGKPVATEQDDNLLQLAAAKRRSRQVKREEESEPARNP